MTAITDFDIQLLQDKILELTGISAIALDPGLQPLTEASGDDLTRPVLEELIHAPFFGTLIERVGEDSIEDLTVEGFEPVKHPKFQIYTDKAGEFRFRLKATNGEIIAVSEGYKALTSCKNGIESVKKNAPEAEVKIEEA